MADRKTVTAFSRQTVEIEPYSIRTLDFIDSKPNFFRVQNSGESPVYCGTSGYPTADRYDFKVRAGSLLCYVEPHYKTKLYILNPSGEKVTCHVMTFAAEFDPLVLALGEIEITMPDIVTTETVISGSLPSGGNKIGTVGITGSLPAGSNEIGKVRLSDTDFLTKCAKAEVRAANGIANATAATVSAGDNYRINKVLFFSNDGEFNITLDFGGQAIVLKAGEVLNDITMVVDSFTVACADGECAYRCLYNRVTV